MFVAPCCHFWLFLGFIILVFKGLGCGEGDEAMLDLFV